MPDVTGPWASAILAGPQSGLVLPITALELDENATQTRYVITTTAQPSITAQQVYDGQDQTGAAAPTSGGLALTLGAPSAAADLPVEYSGDVHVSVVLIDAGGNRSAPTAVGPVSVNTATPAFLSQPAFDAPDYLAGATASWSMGTGTVGASITLKTFALDGSDRSGEISGTTWDTTGEARGRIALRARVTNDVTGLFAQSDVITADLFELPAVMAAPAVTANGTTALSVALAGAPDDGGQPITGYDLRYSTDETTWTVIGDISDPQDVTGLAPGTLFYVQTRAANIGGAGGWSASGAAATSAGGDVIAPSVSSISVGAQSGVVLPLTAAGLSEDAASSRYVVTTAAQPSITAQQVYDGLDEAGVAAPASGTVGLTLAQPTDTVSLPVEYSGDVHVTVVLIDGAGNRSAPISVAPVSVDTVTPVFLTQPAFDATDLLSGATITRTFGTTPAGITITVEQFTLNGADKEPEVTGNAWDSTGAARGTLAFQARATNDVTGLFALSNVITSDLFELPAAMAAPAVTAAGTTALSVALAGAPDDGGQPITGYDLRYSTDEATWTVIGDVSDPQDVTGLAPGTLFYVQTRASNIGGAGGWSVSGAAATDAGATPPMPSGIMVGPQAANGDMPLVISGLDKDAPDSYLILTAAPQTTLTSAQVIAGTDETNAVAADAVAFSVTQASPTETPGLAPGHDGDFHVYVVLGDGAGAYSDPIEATPAPVAIDTVAPVLLSGSPADDTTDVPVGSVLVLSMDEPVSAGTGSISLVETGSGPVETFDMGTGAGDNGGTVTVAGRDITLTPGAALPNGAACHVAATAAALVDAHGNDSAAITDPTVYNFTTVAAVGGGTPQQLGAALTDTTNSRTAWETVAVTPTGVGPLVVKISTMSGSTTGETIGHCTIGAQGRTQGTGSAYDAVRTARRSRLNSFIFRFDDPGTAPVTVQFGVGQKARACIIEVWEYPGNTGAQAGVSSGSNGTTSPRTVGVTTQADDAYVAYWCGVNSAGNNDITWSGVDAQGASLYSGGGSTSNDCVACGAWERVASAGAADAAASFTAAAHNAAIAMEIQS